MLATSQQAEQQAGLLEQHVVAHCTSTRPSVTPDCCAGAAGPWDDGADSDTSSLLLGLAKCSQWLAAGGHSQASASAASGPPSISTLTSAGLQQQADSTAASRSCEGPRRHGVASRSATRSSFFSDSVSTLAWRAALARGDCHSLAPAAPSDGGRCAAEGAVTCNGEQVVGAAGAGAWQQQQQQQQTGKLTVWHSGRMAAALGVTCEAVVAAVSAAVRSLGGILVIVDRASPCSW